MFFRSGLPYEMLIKYYIIPIIPIIPIISEILIVLQGFASCVIILASIMNYNLFKQIEYDN